MRPVHAPRWAAFRRWLLDGEGAIGAAALVTAALLFLVMVVRVIIAWRAGLL